MAPTTRSCDMVVRPPRTPPLPLRPSSTPPLQLKPILPRSIAAIALVTSVPPLALPTLFPLMKTAIAPSLTFSSRLSPWIQLTSFTSDVALARIALDVNGKPPPTASWVGNKSSGVWKRLLSDRFLRVVQLDVAKHLLDGSHTVPFDDKAFKSSEQGDEDSDFEGADTDTYAALPPSLPVDGAYSVHDFEEEESKEKEDRHEDEDEGPSDGPDDDKSSDYQASTKAAPTTTTTRSRLPTTRRLLLIPRRRKALPSRQLHHQRLHPRPSNSFPTRHSASRNFFSSS
ncbi:hypothetical protein V7S43_010193 [Phytophthora oleae]|uniref:RxLR effector protein n=1 Tax=Phytophthora oleae TaxID=2107226 RepID=A0ABD3FE37_9STRA